MTAFQNAFRIWLDDKGSRPNVFMALRRGFELKNCIDQAVLRIMADSNFIAYLDGKEIGRGQFPDNPGAETFSELALGKLDAGYHLLALSVYHIGDEFAVYTPNLPGVVFELLDGSGKTVLCSDADCRVIPTPGFKAGEIAKLTCQLGFTMQYDARLAADRDWTQVDYDDSKWSAPYAVPEERNIVKRPDGAIPVKLPFSAGKRVKSGLLCRRSELDSVAGTMSMDLMFFHHKMAASETLTREPENCSGWVLIYDLGMEMTGFISFALEAPAGTLVDFAHGEHLDDGHVRMECFGRHFADRYICRGGGVERFNMPFRRVGARYLEFHIIPPDDSAEIRFVEAGVEPWVLPLPEPAAFNTPDEQLLKIRKNSITTLECCMHEHYEDCPWREQALYTYDSRNQMLYGYYLWGNYKFAAASLNLFGGVVREDGQLRLCAPTKLHLVIPMFTAVWPLQIYEYTLFSGDFSVWKQQRENLRFIRKKLAEKQDAATTLYLTPGTFSEGIWNFYEWADGEIIVDASDKDIHAQYNLYFANMLDSLGKLEQLDGDAPAGKQYIAEAQRIRETVEKLFYMPEENCYASYMHDGTILQPRHEHTQVLMLYSRVVPAERVGNVLKKLCSADSGLTPLTLGGMPYLMEALLLNDYGREAKAFVRQKLEKDFYSMLTEDSTTCWETQKGGDDFLFAGSLCHGWSSLPVFYCGAGLLGVMPLEAGFKRFRVRPYGDGRPCAEGEIPTPAGKIFVRWERNAEGKLDLTVRHPAALEPVVEEWTESPLGKVVLESF